MIHCTVLPPRIPTRYQIYSACRRQSPFPASASDHCSRAAGSTGSTGTSLSTTLIAGFPVGLLFSLSLPNLFLLFFSFPHMLLLLNVRYRMQSQKLVSVGSPCRPRFHVFIHNFITFNSLFRTLQFLTGQQDAPSPARLFQALLSPATSIALSRRLCKILHILSGLSWILGI